MYRGKDERRPDNMPVTLYPVMKLTEPGMYHDKQYILGTDNWYTQIGIVECVCSAPRSMHFVGTIKSNKRGLPGSSSQICFALD